MTDKTTSAQDRNNEKWQMKQKVNKILTQQSNDRMIKQQVPELKTQKSNDR